MELFEVWIRSFGVVMLFLTGLWLLSVLIKNASIIDPFWGTGFIIISLFALYITGNYSPRTVLVTVLVSTWGIRLSLYLLARNMGKGEDPRYVQFRKTFGEKRYWWFSFFQVFLLQGVLMIVVALPLVSVIATNSSAPLSYLDLALVLLWLVGFIFEAGGDLQLALFKRNPDNRGKVMNQGLWRYTRHPNYFGNSMMWWSLGLFGVIYSSPVALVSPVVMTYLLVKVSGVGLLEKTLKTSKPKYVDYIQSTSAFIPWFPKKSKAIVDND